MTDVGKKKMVVCDEYPGEFFRCGYCEDALADNPEPRRGNQRRTGRAYRRQMGRQKLAKQATIANYCSCMTMSVGYRKSGLPNGDRWATWGSHFNRDTLPVTYITRSKNSNRKKHLKRHANKLFRRTKIISQGKGWYKKVFDVMRVLW